jgi:peptidoglycan hydrolase CwlO-like protein
MEFDLIKVALGVGIGVIGWFLKNTMQDLKDVKQMSFENKAQLDLIKNDYQNKIDHITEKFDELKQTMNDLIKEIKELNKVWHKRN